LGVISHHGVVSRRRNPARLQAVDLIHDRNPVRIGDWRAQ
jgi:hypothetical protein